MQPRFGNRTTARPSRTRGTAAVSKIRCSTRKAKTWRRPDSDSQLRPRRLRLHFVVGLRLGSFSVSQLSLRCAEARMTECAFEPVRNIERNWADADVLASERQKSGSDQIRFRSGRCTETS